MIDIEVVLGLAKFRARGARYMRSTRLMESTMFTFRLPCAIAYTVIAFGIASMLSGPVLAQDIIKVGAPLPLTGPLTRSATAWDARGQRRRPRPKDASTRSSIPCSSPSV